MSKDLVIGVDASTTGCKAMVWDLEGRLVSGGRVSIPLINPRPDWHEQDAADWWQALSKSLRIATSRVDVNRLVGMCICPQRETFVPVDRKGIPVRNAILWMDNRARSLMADIVMKIGAGRFHSITGKPLSGNLTLLKINWLMKNEPDVFDRAAKFVDVAAYLNFKLTGEWGTGWGISGPTGLFDMRSTQWSGEILTFLGLDKEHMPFSYPTGSLLGTINRSAAEECGLQPGLPVLVGLGDGQAGGLGLDITRPGNCYLSLGTSVVSGTYSDRYVTDSAFRTMFAGIPDRYSLETVILGGTYTIDWFLDNFSGGQNIEQLEKDIQDLPPGSQGLMLVPYWSSALNPYWNSRASGIVVGWRGRHQPRHLFRAVLEGIAFELRLHFEGVRAALEADINALVVTGGGSHSDNWCQIIADVTGKTVQRSTTSEATALGAGIIAACGVGLFDDFRSAASAMKGPIQDRFTPDSKRHQQYSNLFEQVYKELYPAIQSQLNNLADLSEVY